MTTTDPYAELEATLAPIRAAHPGISLAEASPLLPKHLRAQMWGRAVDRYLDAKLTELDARPEPKPVKTVTTILDAEATA